MGGRKDFGKGGGGRGMEFCVKIAFCWRGRGVDYWCSAVYGFGDLRFVEREIEMCNLALTLKL